MSNNGDIVTISCLVFVLICCLLFCVFIDAPGAIFAEVINRRTDMDMQVKMREDPLYAIRYKQISIISSHSIISPNITPPSKQ